MPFYERIYENDDGSIDLGLEDVHLSAEIYNIRDFQDTQSEVLLAATVVEQAQSGATGLSGLSDQKFQQLSFLNYDESLTTVIRLQLCGIAGWQLPCYQM